jgi:hypothetical protein
MATVGSAQRVHKAQKRKCGMGSPSTAEVGAVVVMVTIAVVVLTLALPHVGEVADAGGVDGAELGGG